MSEHERDINEALAGTHAREAGSSEPPKLEGEIDRWLDGDTVVAAAADGRVCEWGVSVWRGTDQPWQWIELAVEKEGNRG